MNERLDAARAAMAKRDAAWRRLDDASLAAHEGANARWTVRRMVRAMRAGPLERAGTTTRLQRCLALDVAVEARLQAIRAAFDRTDRRLQGMPERGHGLEALDALVAALRPEVMAPFLPAPAMAVPPGGAGTQERPSA